MLTNLGQRDEPRFPGSFNYPSTTNDERKFADMDLEIEDGELSGLIQVEFTVGEAVSCDLTMQGIDGNWSGQWHCLDPANPPLFAFTAIPFRVEPGQEKVAGR
jgi:hypothetical protein